MTGNVGRYTSNRCKLLNMLRVKLSGKHSYVLHIW